MTVNDANQYRITRLTGTLTFALRWSDMGTADASEVRTAMGNVTASSGFTNGPYDAPNDAGGTLYLRRASNSDFVDTVGTVTATHYLLYASRFFNGQTVLVRPDGITCAAPTPALGTPNVGGDGTTAANAPWVTLQLAAADCSARHAGAGGEVRVLVRSACGELRRDGQRRRVEDAGARARPAAASRDCSRCRIARVQQQLTLFAPFLQNEIPIDPATRWPVGYAEDAPMAASPRSRPSGACASAGNTPIAETIKDVKFKFTNDANLWPAISELRRRQPDRFPRRSSSS